MIYIEKSSVIFEFSIELIAKRFVMPECFPDKIIRGHAYRASMILGSYKLYSRSKALRE